MEYKQKSAKAPAKRGRPKKTDGAIKKKAEPKKTRIVSQPEDVLFALDIGTRTVVGIVGVWKDETLHVLDYEQMEHKGRAMSDGQIEDIEKVGALIKELRTRLEKRLKLRLTRVAIAAAGRSLRTVRAKSERDIEPRTAIDRETLVGLEGEAIERAHMQVMQSDNQPAGGYYCVGYSIVEYCMDGLPIQKLIGHICSHAAVDLIAAFLPNSVVEGLYAAMDASGLEVVSLTLEPIAAMNVLIPRELRLLNLALADIGAGTSDIAICRDGLIHSYDMATVAGDEITETIIQACLVDFETAERMKKSLSLTTDDAEDIAYQNVLGMDFTISRGELCAIVRPAVQSLADTIAEKICDCNTNAPAAVFLIGGGSQAPGLCEDLSNALSLPPSKIAVGARRNLKNVEISGFDALRGPEFVTPLGIAITSLTQECFHFFGVTVNNKRLKLLNFKHMRMIEVLLMAGYRTSAIIGQSGRSLHYRLNGEQKFIKGGYAEHAELKRNGESANVETPVQAGDIIEITPARHGAHAFLRIEDILYEPDTPSLRQGEIMIDGKPVALGFHCFANGAPVDKAYEIRQQDDIRIESVRTLRDACRILKLKETRQYMYDAVELALDTPLLPGMEITSAKTQSAKVQADTKPKNGVRENAQAQASNAQAPAPLHIFLNDEPLRFTPAHEGEVLLMHLLLEAGVDPENPKGLIAMRVNGIQAGFTDAVHDGDHVEIGWENPY